jgi:CHAT domain-containing protein
MQPPRFANGARRFRNPAAKVLPGQQRNPACTLKLNPARFSIIHIAAHAEANRQSPLDSAVILSSGAEGFKLYPRDAVNIPLRADLVIICACRRSGARPVRARGWSDSRGHSCEWAHARSLPLYGMCSSTSLLMNRLYKQIQAGQQPADARRSAKLSLIRTNYSKAYYWAPFRISNPLALGRPAQRI